MPGIPLRALVCDPNEVTANALVDQLKRHADVASVATASDIADAQQLLRTDDINTVFIDPLASDLEVTSDFIFSVRKTLPEIVFALYMDVATAEAQRGVFYQGERQRFSHYYKLDKSVPVPSFPDEVDSVIHTCQSDLIWRLSRRSLKRIAEERKGAPTGQALDDNIRGQVEELVANVFDSRLEPKKNTVFLSYRFAETEYAEGLIPFLEERGFAIVTGKRSNTFISRAIIDRIRDCEYFLCLMTRDKEKTDGTFTTSPWLLEEKGAALAFGKQIVLMIEEGVDDFGGLQGDWQRIHFGPRGFLKAALEAAQQLASYSGRGDEGNANQHTEPREIRSRKPAAP